MVPDGKIAKYRCHRCGEEFPNLTGKHGVQDHADAEHHGRFEVILKKEENRRRTTRII